MVVYQCIWSFWLNSEDCQPVSHPLNKISSISQKCFTDNSFSHNSHFHYLTPLGDLLAFYLPPAAPLLSYVCYSNPYVLHDLEPSQPHFTLNSLNLILNSVHRVQDLYCKQLPVNEVHTDTKSCCHVLQSKTSIWFKQLSVCMDSHFSHVIYVVSM